MSGLRAPFQPGIELEALTAFLTKNGAVITAELDVATGQTAFRIPVGVIGGRMYYAMVIYGQDTAWNTSKAVTFFSSFSTYVPFITQVKDNSAGGTFGVGSPSVTGFTMNTSSGTNISSKWMAIGLYDGGAI